MLILTRKSGQRIVVGDVVFRVLSSDHGRVKIGIEAPRERRVVRGELMDRERLRSGRQDASGPASGREAAA
jgi:carbon storage regulator